VEDLPVGTRDVDPFAQILDQRAQAFGVIERREPLRLAHGDGSVADNGVAGGSEAGDNAAPTGVPVAGVGLDGVMCGSGVWSSTTATRFSHCPIIRTNACPRSGST